MSYKYYQGAMKERISKLALLTIALLFALTAAVGAFSFASARGNGNISIADIEPGICQDVEVDGETLTANYINEAPASAFTVTCDIGVFVNEDINLSNVQVNAIAEEAEPTQYGVYVLGSKVNIRNSSINVEEDFPHQLIGIAYLDGATGTVQNSTISGAHRVGVLVRSENTHVTLLGNVIEGTGAKTSGWAENGVQVDQGATVDLRNNTVAGHWWDGESNWASTGIMLFGSGNSVVNNTLDDNEFGMYVFGNDNRVTGNTLNSDVVSESGLGFKAYGALVSGNDNHLAGNTMTTTNGAAGVYVYDESNNNKFTGNRISGFTYSLNADEGTNMVRGLVTPKE